MQGRGWAAFEPPENCVIVAAEREVQADLADVLRACKRADDVIAVKPRPLEAVERKQYAADYAALPGAVVPDDPGYTVLEDYLLVAEPLEVLHPEPIQQHSLPLCGVR